MNQIKNKYQIKAKLQFAIYSLLCAVILLGCSHDKEQTIELSESDFLIVTERAFMEGYKSALLKEHQDTAWIILKNDYREVFK